MNVRCPHCQSTFRVDPERVPPAGIKARCSRCSNIFQLSRDGAVSVPAPAVATSPVAAAAPVTPPPIAPQPTMTPQPPAPPRVVPQPAPTVVQPPVAPPPPMTPRPIPQTPPPMATVPPPAATAPPPAAASAKRPSFRNQDPTSRAQRLARALVSDIVAYNKDKLKQVAGADAGTFRTEFREEIRKSWEEYVEQVGLELAKGTPFFRDALNEILAKGNKVF